MVCDRLKSPRLFAAGRPLVAVALLLGLAACSSFNEGTRNIADAITIYRPEVVQGNFVSKEQVEALKAGMTRLQVRDILGTPLLTSLFHGDRWDYVFTMQRQGVEPQHYRLTLYFKGDTLERFEGDEMPSENDFVERIGKKVKPKVPVLEATEEQLAKFPASTASSPKPPRPSSPSRRAPAPTRRWSPRAERARPGAVPSSSRRPAFRTP